MNLSRQIIFKFLIRTVIVIVLGVIVFKPISQLCFDGMEEDIELSENCGEEDSEEEIDDLEEKDKFFDEYENNPELLSVSEYTNKIHYLPLKAQFKEGVKSPPPEVNTLL